MVRRLPSSAEPEDLSIGVPVLPNLELYSISTWCDFSHRRFHPGTYIEEAVSRVYVGPESMTTASSGIAVVNGQLTTALVCIIVFKFMPH